MPATCLFPCPSFTPTPGPSGSEDNDSEGGEDPLDPSAFQSPSLRALAERAMQHHAAAGTTGGEHAHRAAPHWLCQSLLVCVLEQALQLRGQEPHAA